MKNLLGEIKLTRNQVRRLKDINLPYVQGFHLVGDTVYVNSASELTDVQLHEVSTALKALPDSPVAPEPSNIRLEELKAKSKLTNDEIVEVLRIRGIL